MADFVAAPANIHTRYGLRQEKCRFHVAMLTAYIDESGVHKGDHVCVVAGFVGNDAQWTSFARDWIPAIRPRTNFHMKSLRWKKEGRIGPLLAKLGPIPHKYNLAPVAVSLHWKDFPVAEGEQISRRFVNPYVICSVACMAVVLDLVVGTDDVYFLFDRQEGLHREAIQSIRDFSFNLCGIDSRFKGAEFMTRTRTVCLDPADYLAYVVREQAINADSFKSKAGASILGSKGGYGGRMKLDQISSMMDWWKQEHEPAEILASLSKRKFFRGPRLPR